MTFNELYYKFISLKNQLLETWEQLCSAFWEMEVQDAAIGMVSILLLIIAFKKLENWKEKAREKKTSERARHRKESESACRHYVNAMEDANLIQELDSLLYVAIEVCPEWEKQLSRVYRECKNRLSI